MKRKIEDLLNKEYRFCKKNEASLDSLVRIADSVGMKLSITLEELQR